MKAELWQLIDRLRSSPRGVEPSALVREIEAQGLTVTEEDIREIVGRFDGGGFIPPKRVVDFVTRLAAGRHISTALDFGCGVVGFVGKALGQQKSKVIALTQIAECATLSRLLCKGTAVEVVCETPLAWFEKTELRFDFVFGMPPFGLKAETSLPFLQETPRRSIDSATAHAAWAGSRLTDDGVAVLIVPTGFAEIQGNHSVETLNACGLSLVAYLSLPPGVFLPSTAVAGALAVVARKPTARVFVGTVSEDTNRNDVLLRNFNGGREGRDVGTGRLVAPADFRGVRVLEAQEQVDRTASRLGLTPTRLQDILVAVNLTKSSEPPGFEEQPNAVYLPMIGRGDAITSIGQFRMKPHNYAQLIVNPAAADPDYLAGFFNTPLGLSIREQSTSGVTIPKLTKATIGLMTVFLPDVNTQRMTVQTQTRLREVSAELRELEKRLWEQPRRCDTVAKAAERFERKEALPDWIDTLPFPLGSILWAYHTCGTDDKVRYEHLLHFFEAYGEFLATVLLSAFSRNQEFFASELKVLRDGVGGNISLQRADFGTWVRIMERFSKTSRQLLNGDAEQKERAFAAFCCRDPETIQALTESRIVSLLQKANSRRNSWTGHGGVVGAPEARDRHTELQTYLTELRECLGVSWERYELVLPGAATFSGGIHRYSIQKVRGRCAPFEKAEVELTHPMEHDVLHLKAQDERSALALLPLIKVMPSPRFAENACYFYNRQERDGIRFVSYHFDKEADVTGAFADTLQAITKLNAAFEQAGAVGS
ncbi:MAG: hypothetical protein FJ398_23435 [Verrucomicrobia bacterium]|nr:hypothetical protein [Verrucomicrobiota bacterium]